MSEIIIIISACHHLFQTLQFNFKEFSTALNFSFRVILFMPIQFTLTYLSSQFSSFIYRFDISTSLIPFTFCRSYVLHLARNVVLSPVLSWPTMFSLVTLYYKRVISPACFDFPFLLLFQGIDCKDSIPKICIKYSLKWNCAFPVPIPTFLFLCGFLRSVCRKKGELVVGIYISLTDT
jgi:hypothetical protein